MRFTSTRNKNENKKFLDVILDCMPQDGGLYIPVGNADLRRWILYTNENTPFASIAGALTSACINDEYSPIICETIATKAFTFEPKLKQLDDQLFMLELFNGPTGSHLDFGVSYMITCLETILQMENKKAIVLDVTQGVHGSIVSKKVQGKKNIKSVLLYPKGTVRGLDQENFVWNGGNVYPIEVDGDEALCHKIAREIFADRSLVEELHLTVSNTTNIGRLLSQAFFYTFAFSRLKNKVHGDIFYAMAPGNYGNLVAGLYSWRLSLPVNGFIVPATAELAVNPLGEPEIVDSMIPLLKRTPCDPSAPTNLERLEVFFEDYSIMIKNFVFPARITDNETDAAAKDLFKKYRVCADPHTAKAFAAALKNSELTQDDGGAIVLIAREHPSYFADYIKKTIGEVVEMPSNIKEVMQSVELKKPFVQTSSEVVSILKSL